MATDQQRDDDDGQDRDVKLWHAAGIPGLR